MGYIKSEFSEIGTSIQLEVRGKNMKVKFQNYHFIKKVMLNNKGGKNE